MIPILYWTPFLTWHLRFWNPNVLLFSAATDSDGARHLPNRRQNKDDKKNNIKELLGTNGKTYTRTKDTLSVMFRKSAILCVWVS